jgi:2-polyprenyl-6-methoxyphenol hydroxylase-like FAD-dependent oxidoreductase
MEDRLDHRPGIGSHALVIGGSMAGLLAARVLSTHFDGVTLVERDRFPEEPAPRKGVPQASHQHLMLKRGADILERLFPGIRGELVATGAPLVDMANDAAWLTPFGWGVRFLSELIMLTGSRDFLEWGVRRRVVTLPNIRFLESTEVTGLLPDASGADCVEGVKIRFRGERGGESSEEILRAELVVDASGRSSRAPRWLKHLGYEPPQESVIDAHLGYTSRLYRIREDFEPGWKGAYVQLAPPEHTRGGALLPIEGGRWLLTLMGTGGDYPPTDEESFLEFARSLRTPILYDAIKGAEALSQISGYRATENRIRRYEKLSRQPHNFVVAGDAVCCFNPVYAQGMTVAALGAEGLEACLRGCRDGDFEGLSSRFQRKLAKVNAAPWAMATAQDLRVPGVIGGSPGFGEKLMSRYMDEVVKLSTESEHVRLRLLEAMNMLKPASALFGPTVALKVLREALIGRDKDETTAPEQPTAETA